MKKLTFIFFIAILMNVGFCQTIQNINAYFTGNSGIFWVIDNGSFTLKSENSENVINLGNLRIENDASLIVTPESYLTVGGTISNNSGTDGLLLKSTAQGTASLLHYSDATDATIERYISGSASLTAFAYHLVSIPLIPATNSTALLFTGAYLYDFNVAGNAWHSLGASTSTALDETRGYMVYFPETSHTCTFEGPMNAGTFNALVTYAGQGFNLVPNPYPSAIDWNASEGWTKTNVDNAIYIWPSGAANYATYVGGVANNGGSQYIPSGQAFFVRTNNNSPVLAMNDAVRVHNARPFYKDDEWIPDLLRITASGNSATDEAVVRFTANATQTADSDFDSWKIIGSEGSPQLYTIAQGTVKLAINSLPYLEQAYVVPMNFEMNAEKPVTLTFTNIESFDGSVTIFLKDEHTNQTINLRSQPNYEFSHNTGNDANRFKLVFGGAIGVEETGQQAENQLWIAGNTLYIKTPQLAGQQGLLEVFDASSKLMMAKELVLSELSTENLKHQGFVIVKLTTDQEVMTIKGILTK